MDEIKCRIGFNYNINCRFNYKGECYIDGNLCNPGVKFNEVNEVKLGWEFKSFGKIPRLSRDVVITEKIDGTNACIAINDLGQVMAGSRTGWVTPENDHYGFAQWVKDNEKELRDVLGFGRHFGEWWGKGINRGYGLNEKRFSLFNTGRWNIDNKPSCCSVVPVLYYGNFDTKTISDALEFLKNSGSIASPGYMNPEGIIIYHTAGDLYFKKTIKKDEEWKGKSK